MADAGSAGLQIIPSFKGFQAALDRNVDPALRDSGISGGQTFGDAAGKSAGKRFGSVFKTAAKASLIGVAALGAGAIKLGMDAIDIASGIEESTNKLEQVFGDASAQVTKFSGQTADALGQSDLAARNAAATFGIFGKSAGLADKQNAKFSIRLTRLASDLASFHDAEPEEVVQALGSALRGEAEPMRKFGVLLDDTTLKAEALALGLLEPVKDEAKIRAYQVKVLEGQQKYNDAVKEYGAESLEALKAEANLGTARESLRKATEGTIPTLTQQQKVLAANSVIFKQTSDAQGDFARTSDSLANQQRRMKARFEDTKAAIGKGLLPIMSDAADFVLDHGLPAFERFSDWFNDKGLPAIQDFAEDTRPLVRELLPAMGDALGTVRDVLGPAAGHAKDLVAAFNDMPDWAKTAIVGGGAGLLLGKKLGLGALAGKAGGSLISKATPVPVFVTNPGFGGAAGGKGAPVPVGGAGGSGGTPFSWLNKGGSWATKFLRGAPMLGAAQGMRVIEGEALTIDEARALGIEIDGVTNKAIAMNTELGRRVKLEIDNRPAKDSLEEVRRITENLRQTIRSLDVRAGGAAAVNRGKLYGDSYGGAITMNFNGVDMAGARREMSHVQRTHAMGGADFRD